MEEECGQRWTTWFLLKEGRYSLLVICSIWRASTVFSWVQSFSSGKETAQAAVHNGITATLRNYSMKSSTNSHVDSSDV